MLGDGGVNRGGIGDGGDPPPSVAPDQPGASPAVGLHPIAEARPIAYLAYSTNTYSTNRTQSQKRRCSIDSQGVTGVKNQMTVEEIKTK